MWLYFWNFQESFIHWFFSTWQADNHRQMFRLSNSKINLEFPIRQPLVSSLDQHLDCDLTSFNYQVLSTRTDTYYKYICTCKTATRPSPGNLALFSHPSVLLATCQTLWSLQSYLIRSTAAEVPIKLQSDQTIRLQDYGDLKIIRLMGYWNRALGPVSISDKTSIHKILWNIKAVRFV